MHITKTAARNTRAALTWAVLAASLASAAARDVACAQQPQPQPPPPSAAPPPPSAAQASAAQPPLQMCLAAAADDSPVCPASAFPSSMREISCVFHLGENEKFEKLTSIWTAVDVGDVAPLNYEMARADLAVKSMKRGKFRYSQDGPLPVGKYRLDVQGDGKPWQSIEFMVEKAKEQPALAQPADLLPLRKGSSWTYDFVQQSGSGVHISGADASGRLQAKVTMKVAGDDAAGAHIEISRNGTLVAEEWWKLTDGGLSAAQRKIGDEQVALDPPQVLCALPLQNGKQWTYQPKDGSYTQTYTMWGPLAISEAPEAPTGKLGWVVFIQQSMPPQEITVERHFVPGFGLTREVIVQTLNGELLNRQEMTLSP